jgi:hypothetical protein
VKEAPKKRTKSVKIEEVKLPSEQPVAEKQKIEESASNAEADKVAKKVLKKTKKTPEEIVLPDDAVENSKE